MINTFNCELDLKFSATASQNVAYDGTATVGYFGGNGEKYLQGSPIGSTNVTGLAAVLQPGTLAIGDGKFIYKITGTPKGQGAAYFKLEFTQVNSGGNVTQCSMTLIVNP